MIVFTLLVTETLNTAALLKRKKKEVLFETNQTLEERGNILNLLRRMTGINI